MFSAVRCDAMRCDKMPHSTQFGILNQSSTDWFFLGEHVLDLFIFIHIISNKTINWQFLDFISNAYAILWWWWLLFVLLLLLLFLFLFCARCYIVILIWKWAVYSISQSVFFFFSSVWIWIDYNKRNHFCELNGRKKVIYIGFEMGKKIVSAIRYEKKWSQLKRNQFVANSCSGLYLNAVCVCTPNAHNDGID